MSKNVEKTRKKLVKSVRNILTILEKYVNLYIYVREKIKKGEMYMLNEEICKLREKLNNSIETGQDYSIIYQLSIELDELIAEYYKTEEKKEKKMQLKCI